MSRSLSYLRRGLLGIAVVSSLGFGATQAFGSPEQPARVGRCYATGYDYYDPACANACPGNIGYCDWRGYCRCGQIP